MMQLETPSELAVEALKTDDIPAAMELKNVLGWNQTPEDWQRFLRLAPEGAFKLLVQGRLAGTALAFVFDDVCWIGMVMVAEAYRGQGHGKMLVQSCLEHAATRRCTLVQLDATRDGVSLYAHLGFKPTHLVGTCRGRIEPPEGGHVRSDSSAGLGVTARRRGEPVQRGETAEVVAGLRLTPIRPGDLAEVAALEAEALGVNREALFRELVGGESAGHPAGGRAAGGRASGGHPTGGRAGGARDAGGRDSTGRVADPGLLSSQGGGMVCRSPEGELTGFLLNRPGYHSVQVGPLIARDDVTAAQLLRATLGEICARSPECDVTLAVPLYNEAMLGELRRWGLPVTPRLTHMFRGRRRLQAREDMVYALSGPEKG
jgi:GNAT superfamily N-acetyltransferase